MFVVYVLLAYCVAAMLIAAEILRRHRRRMRQDPREDFASPDGLASARVLPLHVVTMRGRRLRFYRSPLTGADFPWAVLRDLFAIATDGADYMVSAEWIYASNPNLAQAILTADGPELLLSHRAGLELLATLVRERDDREALAADFREGMAEAYVLQWAGLSREEFLALCAEASRRAQAGSA